MDRRHFLRNSPAALGLVGLLPAACSRPAPEAGLPRMNRSAFLPAYLKLERAGELAEREKQLQAIFSSCRLCPRACGANRRKGEKGVCQATSRLKVSSAHPHYGEERPLVGRGGSGAIFFSHCNLLCVYCQNWEISHRGDGQYISDEQLARLMLSLQEHGCHNINLVTPTHVAPNIVSGLRHAIRMGLHLPLVYNTGGYDSLEVIRLLDGIVDIYLPDYKYTDPEKAAKYSTEARDYPEVAAAVIEEMHRQVGELTVDERGVAVRGLIIRHLVLPEDIAGTEKFVKYVAERLTRGTYVNIMAQYHPAHRAREYPELSRRITAAEYQRAIALARQYGLTNLDRG
jgi:putative pyruvate formate lyase activating enzyme